MSDNDMLTSDEIAEILQEAVDLTAMIREAVNGKGGNMAIVLALSMTIELVLRTPCPVEPPTPEQADWMINLGRRFGRTCEIVAAGSRH